MIRLIPHLLIAGALFAGCGSDDDAGSTPAKPTGAAAAGSQGPFGTYVRSVTRADLDRTDGRREEYGPHQELPGTGEYQLVVAKGSAQDVLKTTGPDGFTIAQDVNLKADAIRLTSYVDPMQGAYCGPEIPAQAAYTYEIEGSTLVLSAQPEDPCADRDSILTGTWKKR